MTCEIAAADHCHPGAFRARSQKLSCHGLTHCIPGATDAAHTLIHQEVFEQKPAELVGEFKGLDETLLLKLTERAAGSKSERPFERC